MLKNKNNTLFMFEYEFFTCCECGGDIPSFAETTHEALEKLEQGDHYNFCPWCGKYLKGETNGQTDK